MNFEMDQRQMLRDALPDKCLQGCTVAKLAIANACADGGTLKENAAEILGQCIDGPFPAGKCGTTKTVCSHPNADTTLDFNEQVLLLQNSIL